ncbi:MAG: hypothetical protein A2X94_07705 [Bdellovibrionales bacterium GWB1_55_8]|nr:MAG: hypothetical protein A2X94_07705 [Bdellovibrionales bacterium GWB1_55_8]
MRLAFISPALLAFSLFFFSGSCQAAALRSNIVGGEIVTQPNLLSQSTVRLIIMFANDERGLCTGTLVSESVVLTAAHCVSGYPNVIRIDFFGSKGIQEYRLGSRYLVHEAYDSLNLGNRNDLALVLFEGGVPLENRPARFLSSDILDFSDHDPQPITMIAGYGLSSAEGEPDDNLRSARLGLGERAGDCIELKPEDHIASGCSGDSGGPAFIEMDGVPYVWGVASYVTAPYCEASTYYTNLGLFHDWRKDASVRLVSAPASPPAPLKLLGKRTVSRFIHRYSDLETDQDRVSAVRDWAEQLKPGTGIDVPTAMEILMAFDQDRLRLEAYLVLSAHLQFDSLKQGQTFMYLFSDLTLRSEAEKTLIPFGVQYLQH